jgi:Bacterial PH domain
VIYRSKKDTWLVLAFALTIAFPVVLGVWFLSILSLKLIGGLLIAIGIAVGIFIYWLVTPLYYEIAEAQLNVRAGPKRWTIPLESITEVVPTRSPLSSPALSLERLLIRYENDHSPSTLMISPENKNTFLRALAIAEPRLELVGNALKSR